MAKVAVATQNGGLEDQVSPVFGRCQTYTIVETENNEIEETEVVQNQYANAMSGAGIQAAGFIANQGAEAIISGNFGPNVVSVFNQSGVEMYSVSGIQVKEAIEKYLAGELEPISQATTSAKSGSGRGMGRGMGRRMSQQSPQQSPQQPGQQVPRTPGQPSGPSSQQEQESGEDRMEDIEERLDNLEKQLKKIGDSLEDLKKS